MMQVGILMASSFEEIISETFGLSAIGRSLAITHRRGVVRSFRLVRFYCLSLFILGANMQMRRGEGGGGMKGRQI